MHDDAAVHEAEVMGAADLDRRALAPAGLDLQAELGLAHPRDHLRRLGEGGPDARGRGVELDRELEGRRGGGSALARGGRRIECEPATRPK